jgi:P27 family predicted phage terminase small subunit
MSKPGPKPEPAAIRLQKGNPGRRPIGSDPVAAAPFGSVLPPAWLAGEGLMIWQRLAPRLERMKLLTPVDAEAFARYCRSFARWLAMSRQLDAEGETYEAQGAHGKLRRAHPAFMISDRLERALVAAEDRFGLNPSERQRLYAARSAAPLPGDLFNQRPIDDDEDQPKQRGPIGLLN